MAARHPAYLAVTYRPSALDEFVDQGAPFLMGHGLFRQKYEGWTLLERLGFRCSAQRNAVP